MGSQLRDHRFGSEVVLTLLLNLLPLVGVFAWGWLVAPLLFFFWLENVAIGIVTLVKLAMARGRAKPEAEDIVLTSEVFFKNPDQGKVLGSFLLFYGSFTIVHGMFLRQFFPLKNIPANEILIAFGCILAAQIALFLIYFIGRGDYRSLSMALISSRAMGRVVLLHIVVLAGGFGVDKLGSPIPGLLALVFLKSIFDLSGQLKIHR